MRYLSIILYAWAVEIIINKFVNFEMGGTESQTGQSCQDLLADFSEIRREPHGVVLADKKSENTYFLKEFSFVNKKQYDMEFKRLQGLESQPQNQNVLSLVRLFSQTFNNICSNSYKIYALYEYPSITLEEEIGARKKEGKYFDECELWSILQSCANALGELKPVLSLHPRNVFIVPDGVLKVINNEMIDEDYRCYLKTGLYYAPEKIKEFKRNDTENSLRKQSIFSLGMTLLHAALLVPVSDCYNYENFEFCEDKLEKHIEQLVNTKNVQECEHETTQRGRYSEEFIEMLAMILEPNPNKRASLMEVHGMLTKVWNTETDEENANNGEEVQDNEIESQKHNQSAIVTMKASKKADQKSIGAADLGLRGDIQKSKKNLKNTETKQPSQAQPISKGPSYLSSFHQSQRQSKPNLNEVSSINSRMVPRPLEASTGAQFPAFTGYVPSTSFMYTPPGLNSALGGLPSLSANKENGLYTDPKLLEMIRKDLQDLNELKKSSMMNTYGVGYSNPYLGSSNYYSSYGDLGTGILSSKSSLGLTTPNIQQIYTVNTQTNYLSQRNENLAVSSSKPEITRPQPQAAQQAAPHKPQQQQQPQQQPQQQGFMKSGSSPVYIVEEYEDGRKFEGTLVNGAKQGHGKLTYSDGAYYEGEFRKDKMEGQGILFYGADRPAYDGAWLADQFHGFGRLYNESPLELNGCFNYNDFNLIQDFWVRYQGNFDCDNKSGEGKLILSNGQQFHGSFENDCINGKGVFLTRDGEQISGVWEDNILVQLDA